MYAKFKNDHYDLFDTNNKPLFNDAEHMRLFNYLNYDLSRIEILLNNFFAEQFDFERMKFRDDRPKVEYNDQYKEDENSAINTIIVSSDYRVDNIYLSEIINILSESHEYYRIDYNAEKEAEKIILEYFHERACTSEIVLDYKNEYVEILNELLNIPPFILIKDTRYPFIEKDIDLRMLVRYAAYYDKYVLYGAKRRKKSKGEKIEYSSPEIIEQQKEINEILIEHMNKAKSKRRKAKIKDNDERILPVSDLNQLLKYETNKIKKTGINIRQCHCCEAFFITDDNRRNYCNRIYRDNKKCSDIGPTLYFYKNKDDSYKNYRAAMSKNQMRLLRKRITDEQYEWWKTKVLELLKNESKNLDAWLRLTIKDINKLYRKESR